jgi:DNA polymerase elongation subunit (family B)
LIKEAQEKMLQVLSSCKDSQEYRERSQEVREVLKEYEIRLQSGEVRNEDLLVAKSVRQKVSEYKVANHTALALQQLDEAGIEIHPGEKVHYLMKDTGSKNKEDRVRAHPFVTADDFYDEEKYEELLAKAAEEVLDG